MALITGVKSFKKGEIIEIDTIVEPDDIIFDYTGNELIIKYGIQQAFISDVNKFIEDTGKSVSDFLNILDDVSFYKHEDKRELEVLRKFVLNI